MKTQNICPSKQLALPGILALAAFFLCLSGQAFAIDPAIKQLASELRPLIKQRHATPIQTVLARHQLSFKTNFTLMIRGEDAEDIDPFAHTKRPKSVTADEWLALKRSPLDFVSENGRLEISLHDLDGDGKRDLIVESYIGGTGLFSGVYTLRRKGAHFEATPVKPNADDSLYTINGRGSNQEGTWIRLQNKIYLAYRDGNYGYDELILLAPFSTGGNSQKSLQVNYRYHNQIITPEETPENKVDPNLQKILQKALDNVDRHPGKTWPACPVNGNTSPDENPGWPWFGASHYTIDVVADFPVWVNGQCGAARLINFKSSYLNTHTLNSLSYLPSANAESMDFEITTQRRAISINH